MIVSITIIKIYDNKYPYREVNLLLNSKLNTAEKTIVIDPGHGGYDVGAIGSLGNQEKKLTLEISLKLGSILQEKGYNVVYTRENDEVSWPSEPKEDLAARAAISNYEKATIFLSIHLNKFNEKSVTGTETYYNEASSQGKVLADLIQKQIIEDLKTTDRGIKKGNFLVLEKVKAPAILVELGYISNESDEKNLSNSDYQNKISLSMTKAIDNYFKINPQN